MKKINEKVLYNFVKKCLPPTYPTGNLSKIFRETKLLDIASRFNYIFIALGIPNFWIKINKKTLAQLPLPAIYISKSSGFPIIILSRTETNKYECIDILLNRKEKDSTTVVNESKD